MRSEDDDEDDDVLDLVANRDEFSDLDDDDTETSKNTEKSIKAEKSKNTESKKVEKDDSKSKLKRKIDSEMPSPKRVRLKKLIFFIFFNCYWWNIFNLFMF